MFGGGGYGSSSFGGGAAGGFGSPAAGTSSLFGGGGAGSFGAAGQGGAGFGMSSGGFGAPAGAGYGAAGGSGFGAGGFGASAGGFGSSSGGAFGAAPGGGGAFGRAPANSPGLGLGGAGGGYGAPAGGGFGTAAGGFGTANPQFGGSAYGMTGAGGSAFGGGGAAGGGAGSSMWGQQTRAGGGGLFGSPQPVAAGGAGAFGSAPGGGSFGAGAGFGGAPQQPGFSGAAGGARGAEMHNPGGEVEIRPEERPTDTITSVRFTPSMDPGQQLVSVSSWDQSVRVFQLFASGVQAKAMANATAPVFDTCFRSDGAAIFSACADGTVQMWNLGGGNQMQTIGRHDAPCSAVQWIPEYSMCVTSGWDTKIKYWDARSPQAAQVVDCKERIHAMSVKSNVLVVACAGPNFPIYVFDLKNPQMPIRERTLKPGTTSHPKMAVRSVAISTDAQYFCCAGIEGRVNIIYVDDNQQNKNFTFRCHKTEETRGAQSLKYHNPVNNLSFHPRTNVLATCGSDGSYCYWDIAERARLHQGPHARPLSATQPSQHKKCMFPGGDRPAPIVAAGFNAEGSIYAYGVGYDWNLGPQWNLPQSQVNAVIFHSVKADDLKKKSR